MLAVLQAGKLFSVTIHALRFTVFMIYEVLNRHAGRLASWKAIFRHDSRFTALHLELIEEYMVLFNI
jgi:hypothetical protein